MGKTTNCLRCGIKCQGKSGYCRVHLNKLKSQKTREKTRLSKYRKARYQKVSQANGTILPPSTSLVYENYKEPLKKVEHGYGYMGTLALNEAKTHVQCHICGFMYKALAAHLRFKHKTTVVEYKKEFGLAVETALIGEATREAFIRGMEHLPKKGELLPGLVRFNQQVQAGLRTVNAKGRRMSLEQRNKQGVCPDQLLERIKVVAKKLGHTPSFDEFRLHTTKYTAIIHTFGSWNKAVKMAGMISVGEQREEEHSPERLLEYLKNFQKVHGRIPMTSDFSRGLLPARYHYHKQFGTLNEARIEAGLPAVIPFPGHRYVLIQPEDWEGYKNRPRKRKNRFRELLHR